MKKVLIIIFVPYLAIIGVIFYVFYGPGLVAGYETLKWNDIETMVPEDFEVKTYQSKNGWDVYSLQKLTVLIKIAVKSKINVSRLPESGPKVKYQTSTGPDDIYYIINPRKTFEVVFARSIGDSTLYFSVATPSVFSGRFIMDKLTANCFYKGQEVVPPEPAVPFSCYFTDLLFLGGMLVPLIIILLIFYLSGKKPAAKHFIGDPIRCEESYVYFSSVRKYRRKTSFCYLALTTTRLMVFVFMKPMWVVNLREEKPDMKIEGKKIIFQKENEKMVLKPSDIEKWKEALSVLLY